MKRLVLAAILLNAAPVFASEKAYDLTIDLSSSGQSLKSSQVTVKEGESAKLDIGNRFIEVVATEDQARKGISMQFTMGTVAKDGKRAVTGHPSVVVMEGQSAKVALEGQAGAPEPLTLAVVAKTRVL